MAEDERASDQPVTIFVGHGRAEAIVVQSKLTDAGIRSHLRYEALTNMYPFNVDGLARFEIQVAAEDAKRAREVLEETK